MTDRALAAMALGAAALTAACTGGANRQTEPPGSTTADTSMPARKIAAVKLTEYSVAPSPSAIKTGSWTFIATNDGTQAHALELTGPNGLDRRTGVLQGGQTGQLDADLAPGTYELYCPVGNHRQQGMDVTITVSAPTTPTEPPPNGGGH